MITAEVMTGITSTANQGSSLSEFIAYSIEHDANLVTCKWLAFNKSISYQEAQKALNDYWLSEGKRKGYCATFVCLCTSPDGSMEIKLVNESELPGDAKAHQIYALHKAPLRDRQSQLGMMNVPIILPPSLKSEHIKAPPISATAIAPSAEPVEDVEMADSQPALKSESVKTTTAVPEPTTTAHQSAPGKRMKMVKVTRTFTENGYQMTETVNEMVPCEEDDPEALPSESNSTATATATATAAAKPKAAAPTAAKQSNLMSFFKKAKQ